MLIQHGVQPRFGVSILGTTIFLLISVLLRHVIEYHVMEQGVVEACHWFQCGHQFSPDDDISVSFVLFCFCSILQDLSDHDSFSIIS